MAYSHDWEVDADRCQAGTPAPLLEHLSVGLSLLPSVVGKLLEELFS